MFVFVCGVLFGCVDACVHVCVCVSIEFAECSVELWMYVSPSSKLGLLLYSLNLDGLTADGKRALLGGLQRCSQLQSLKCVIRIKGVVCGCPSV